MNPAQQFAVWLEKEHPDIYAHVYMTARQSHFRGFGDDASDGSNIASDVAAMDTSSQDLRESGGYDTSSSAPVLSDPTISDVSVSDVGISSPNIVTQPASGTASGVLDSLSQIGSWLISPQGLTTVANTAGAVLKVQQAQATAQLQRQVIAANANRAAAGQSVVPITYTQNAQGQVIPVYDTGTMSLMPPELETAIQQGRAHMVSLPDGSTGYAIDNPTLNSLLGSTGIPLWGWGLGLLLLVLLAR